LVSRWGVTHILIAVLIVVAAMILRVCITKLPQKAGINVVVGVIVAATFNGVQAIFLPPLLGWGLAYTRGYLASVLCKMVQIYALVLQRRMLRYF